MSESHPGARRYNLSLEDFGAIEGSGRECEYVRQCDAASVYAAVHPGSDGVPVRVCPYHVGLYEVDHPDHYQRHVEAPIADPDPYKREDRFYRLRMLPERIRQGEFRRIGLDHGGVGHYASQDDETGAVMLLEVDRSLDLLDVRSVRPADVEMGDYLKGIERSRGWVDVDQELLESARVRDPSEERGPA